MVDLMAMKIMGEQVASKFVGPVVSQINHCAHVRVAAINRIASHRACTAGAVIVAGGSQKKISHPRVVLWRIGHDEWWIVRVGLVPIMPALDDVSCRPPSPVASTVRHEDLSV